MEIAYSWLIKRTPRSVDAMHLWSLNPRLDPSETYITIRDFAEEIITTNADKEDFLDLVKSISEKGFIPADPIVVWRNETNDNYYVAEGNRRVLALKLLRSPQKAPMAIRTQIQKYSDKINTDAFEKIPVCVAPTFDDAEWYISQRNSLSSFQRKWTSEQQRRWIITLYDKYNGDVSEISKKIDLSEGELQKNIRILKLKEYVSNLNNILSDEEFQKATSIRFPITTFERFFSNPVAREFFGIEYDGFDVKLTKDRQSFLEAFAIVIRRMIVPDEDESRIDSRTIGTADDIQHLIGTLPQVISIEIPPPPPQPVPSPVQTAQPATFPQPIPAPTPRQKDGHYRNRLIDYTYNVSSTNYRITEIFNELKSIPFLYPNSIAATIRILLDLSVLNYIQSNSLEPQILAHFHRRDLREVILSNRLEFIKQNAVDPNVVRLITRLLTPSHVFSLDVLNGYQHSNDNHFINKPFLNQFWNFLFPLFRHLLQITETP